MLGKARGELRELQQQTRKDSKLKQMRLAEKEREGLKARIWGEQLKENVALKEKKENNPV